MKIEDLLGIESSYLDYKESLEKEKPKSWLKSVVAFANTKGGHIVFGVTDKNHELVGLDNPQEVASKISELINSRIQPHVRFSLKTFESRNVGKKCIDLEISNGPDYPYYYVHEKIREIYVRRGDRSELSSEIEQKNLILKGTNRTFDALPSQHKYTDTSFTLLAATFKKETGEDFNIDKDLISMRFITEDNIVTNAGVLMCDQGWMKQSKIVCTRWKGESKGSIEGDALDDKEFTGASLITLLAQAESFIKNNSKNPWTIKGMKREENSDYPFKAVRECLVNALIHRDYQNIGAEIHVDMFDKRMEISSPGGMLNGSRIQDLDLKHVSSMRRNEIISDIFSRLGFMDRRGSGLKRIMDSYRDFFEKPEFYSDESIFEVTLPNRNKERNTERKANIPNKNTSTQLSDTSTQLSDTSTQLSDTSTQLSKELIDTAEIVEWLKSKGAGSFQYNTFENLIKLYQKYGEHYCFNRANVAYIFHISENAASRVIKTCISCGIIRKEKNGEYYFDK